MDVTRKHYYDAGHGWVAVKIKELVDLGILDKISTCSYFKGKTAYLEEDCDAQTYSKALEAAGKKLKVKSVYHAGRSRIRSHHTFDAKLLAVLPL